MRDRITSIIDKMFLEEKIDNVGGSDVLGHVDYLVRGTEELAIATSN